MAESSPMELLRGFDLFKGLTDEELMEFEKLCSEHSYETGELCQREGDLADSVYFIKMGKVSVEIQISQSLQHDQNKVDAYTLVGGQIFAFPALVTGTLTTSIKAVEPTVALVVNANGLLSICEKKPHIGYVIMKNLATIIDSRRRKVNTALNAAYRELSEAHQHLKESQEQLIQAEKLSSLGQMAAAIAHEVNNPLSGVLVYTKLLSKKISGDSISKQAMLDYLSKMDSELTRSTWLIRNLLDFARQSAPTLREVDLNEVIDRALDLAAHSAELQNIKVMKELNPSLPRLMADFDQLKQVCTNLILNAIQAMPQGGRLTLRTSADGSQVKVEFQDTGCGIPPENMPKLFTPFFTTKREVKGVGLGLAVSYGIIQRHQGRIEVQSKVGEGTTFIIYLPLHPEEKR